MTCSSGSKTHHHSGLLRNSTVDSRTEAESTVIPMQHSGIGFRIAHIGIPHQRAVSENPDSGLTVDRFQHFTDIFFQLVHAVIPDGFRLLTGRPPLDFLLENQVSLEISHQGRIL